jgi:hypothetical protein
MMMTVIPLLSKCKVALTMIQRDVLSQNTNMWPTLQQHKYVANMTATVVIHMTYSDVTGRNTSAQK